MGTWRSGLLALGFGAGLAWQGLAAEGSYQDEIEAWRQKREERLKAPGGWLSVAGLYWLEPGPNALGTAPDGAIVLPEGSAPPRAGVLELADGKVTLRLEPGVAASVAGQPVAGPLEMRPDTSGEPTVLELGPRLTLYVIERGERLGIRLKDLEAPRRKAFAGLQWFPVDEAARVVARFEPYEAGRTVQIPNILGTVESMQAPGVAIFTLGGQELRLEPVIEDPNDPALFFIFADATNGRETYGSGRFLYAAMPEDGKVVLDFNKAYSPPCAFTDYATCPLPPPQNRLKLALEAGEKFEGHGPGH